MGTCIKNSKANSNTVTYWNIISIFIDKIIPGIMLSVIHSKWCKPVKITWILSFWYGTPDGLSLLRCFLLFAGLRLGLCHLLKEVWRYTWLHCIQQNLIKLSHFWRWTKHIFHWRCWFKLLIQTVHKGPAIKPVQRKERILVWNHTSAEVQKHAAQWKKISTTHYIQQWAPKEYLF